ISNQLFEFTTVKLIPNTGLQLTAKPQKHLHITLLTIITNETIEHLFEGLQIYQPITLTGTQIRLMPIDDPKFISLIVKESRILHNLKMDLYNRVLNCVRQRYQLSQINVKKNQECASMKIVNYNTIRYMSG